MSVIGYVAQRRLAPGHTANTFYEFDFGARAIRPKVEIMGQSNVSIGGQQQFIHQNTKNSWTIQVNDIDRLNDLPFWHEFLYSVSQGEVFSFDPYGSLVQADSPIDVVLSGNSWSENGQEYNHHFQLSFTVKEQ